MPRFIQPEIIRKRLSDVRVIMNDNNVDVYFNRRLSHVGVRR